MFHKVRLIAVPDFRDTEVVIDSQAVEFHAPASYRDPRVKERTFYGSPQPSSWPSPRTIFLIDALGALISVLLTGWVLPVFHLELGIPKNVLYLLAIFPLVFASYSWLCFFVVRHLRAWMLRAIIGANLFYCCLSGLLIWKLESLTPLGHVILVCEIAVVLVVVGLELKVLDAHFPKGGRPSVSPQQE
jgi:hypothetical protein